jgi:oligoribonuclease (3'-5' exoribonuclease)
LTIEVGDYLHLQSLDDCLLNSVLRLWLPNMSTNDVKVKVKIEAVAIHKKPADDKRKNKNYQQRNRNNNVNRPPKKERFEGACAKLKGHVFTAGYNRSDQLRIYAKTLEKIKIHVNTNYLPLVGQTIETDTDVNYVEPYWLLT